MKIKTRLSESLLTEAGIPPRAEKIYMRVHGMDPHSSALPKWREGWAKNQYPGSGHLVAALKDKALNLGSYRYWPTDSKGTAWVASDGSKIRTGSVLEFICDYADEYAAEDLVMAVLEDDMDGAKRYIVPRKDQAGHELAGIHGGD